MKIRLNVYPGLLGPVLVFTLGRHGLRGEEEGPEGTSVAAGGGRAEALGTLGVSTWAGAEKGVSRPEEI